MMKKLMLAVAELMMAMGVFADNWTDPETEITWTYSVEFGEACVVRASPVEGDISIPSKLGERNVTIIGDSAFYGCKSLTSVTIPEGVMDVRRYAFTGCNSMTNVAILGGVTSIGDYAFSGCSSLINMMIPEGVTRIGKNAFGECSSLTSVTIPKSVVSIGDTAFRGCSQSLEFVVDVGNRDYKSEYGFLLSKNGLVLSAGTNISGVVTIPSDATSIDGFSFCRRSGLISVMIPPSVTNIGEYAFWECGGLTSVTIPAGVASIGKSAYLRCNGLRAVDFEGAPPAALTEASISRDVAIRYNVAYEDEWLPVIEECGFTNATPYVPHAFPDGGPYAEIVNGIEWTFVVAKGEARVGGGCCKSAVPASTEGVIEIPTILGGRKVTGVGDGAFANNERITRVVIPSGVYEIGEEAFWYCKSLTEVFIPEGLTTICKNAFWGCSKLEEVVLPQTLATIWEGAFAFSALKSVVIPGGVTLVGVLDYWNGQHFGAFDSCWQLRSVCFEEGVDSIESYAFRDCWELKRIILPSSIRACGMYAFSSCQKLKTVYVANVPREKERIGALLEEAGFDTGGVMFLFRDYEVIGGVKSEIDIGLIGYKASGLPRGLSYDAKKGNVTGTAMVTGEYEVTFTKKGEDDVVMTFIVRKEKEPTIECPILAANEFTAGVSGAEGGIPLWIDAESGVKSITAKNLPAGMKIFQNKTTKEWTIQGGATKTGTFDVVLTMTTVAGTKVEAKYEITVSPPHEMTAGTFNGFVTQKSMFDAGFEKTFGAIQVTATDAGKITAKITAAAKTYSFSATAWSRITDGGYEADMALKSGETLALVLNQNARWEEHQLSGRFAFAEMPTNGMYFEVSAQRNAYAKQWYFDVKGDEDGGWTFAYAAEPKKANLTVSWNADGKTSVAGKLGTFKVTASGYCDVSGISEGAVMADFAPVVTVNKVKKILSIKTILWFDRKNDHDVIGSARLVE